MILAPQAAFHRVQQTVAKSCATAGTMDESAGEEHIAQGGKRDTYRVVHPAVQNRLAARSIRTGAE